MDGSVTGKNARIFGKQIIDVFFIEYSTEEIVHLAIGHGECEIFTKSWDLVPRLPQRFMTSDVKWNKTDQEGVIHFIYQTQGKTIEFHLSCEGVDLTTYFQAQTEKKEKESSEAAPTLTVDVTDLMTFASACTMHQGVFRQHLEAQARKRVLFLTGSTEISDSLVNAIAVEFKMRFPQIEPENWSGAFEVMWYEFVGFCVSLWGQCLKTAIEPHTGENSSEYFRRLTASIAAMIGKCADVFRVDRNAFLLAIKEFLESSDASHVPPNVPAESRDIVHAIERSIGNVRKQWILQLTDLFEFTQLFSVSIAIAQALGEKTEVTKLSERLCAWAMSLVNNVMKGPRTIVSVGDLRNGAEKLAVAVLKLTDKQRYSPMFSCTFALWKLSELVKSSD